MSIEGRIGARIITAEIAEIAEKGASDPSDLSDPSDVPMAPPSCTGRWP